MSQGSNKKKTRQRQPRTAVWVVVGRDRRPIYWDAGDSAGREVCAYPSRRAAEKVAARFHDAHAVRYTPAKDPTP